MDQARASAHEDGPSSVEATGDHDDVEILPPPPLAKRIALLVAVVIFVLLAVPLVMRLMAALETQQQLEVARQEAAEAAGAAAEVAVVHPTPAESAPFVVLTGALAPIQAADLAFGVAGQVATVPVSLGQRVSEGDVLVTLDRASVGAQSAQSAAAIQVAEANAEMLRDRVGLAESLVSRGSMAERELTTARQQLAVAEAQLLQARAGRQQVAATSANHVLRAPFDGVVTQVPSGVGVAANPGVTLVRVEDLSALRLRTTVNRRELEVLRVGMTASIEGTQATGALTAVVRSLDQDSRRAPVEVTCDNASGTLVANALVRARVDVGATRSVLRIPAPARRPDGTVLVVGEDSRVEPRPVSADVDLDGSWLVSDGLSESDRVVVRPALVREGHVITPVDATDQGAAAEGPS